MNKPSAPRLALIAHDHKKDSMLALASEFLPLLQACQLMATGTTGGRLCKELGLEVECLLSGPMGGDLQIGARLAVGEVDAVVFLRDPMTPQPHEPDINARCVPATFMTCLAPPISPGRACSCRPWVP